MEGQEGFYTAIAGLLAYPDGDVPPAVGSLPGVARG